jgi:hypothetical protein
MPLRTPLTARADTLRSHAARLDAAAAELEALAGTTERQGRPGEGLAVQLQGQAERSRQAATDLREAASRLAACGGLRPRPRTAALGTVALLAGAVAVLAHHRRAAG